MIDIHKRGEFDLLELNSNKIYKQTSKILPTKLLLVNRSKDEVILQVDINKNIPKDTLSYSDFVTNFTNVLDDSKLFNFDIILKTSDIQDDLSVLLFGYHDIDNAGSKYIVPRDCCLGSAKIKEFLCGKSLRNPSNVFRLSIFIIDGVVKAKIALLDSVCGCPDNNINLKVHNIAPVQHNYETNIIQTTPDLHNYVTKDSLTHFVNELIKDKLDKSVLIDFVNIDILKDELKSYYDKNEIDMILKSFNVDLSDYYNKNEIDSKLNNIKTNKINLSDYYNKNEIDDIIESALKNAVDLSDYYKKKDTYNKYEIDNKIANIKPKEIDLSNYYNKNETYNKDEIDKKFDEIPELETVDLSNYYNKNETYNKDEIANLLSDVQTGDVDLSDYYKKDAVYNKFEIDAKLSGSSAGGGSLDNYYTKKETNKLFDDLLETRIPYDIIQALREGYESENIEVDLGEYDDILWAGSEVAAVKFDENVIHVKSPLYNVDIPHEFNILSYSLVPMGNGLLGVFVQTSEKNVAGWVADVITGNLTKTYEEADIFDVKVMKRHDLRYSNDISNESIFELSKRGIHKDRNILIPFILKESKGISFVSNNLEKLSILLDWIRQPGIVMEVTNVRKGDIFKFNEMDHPEYRVATSKIEHDYIVKSVDKIHGCFISDGEIILSYKVNDVDYIAKLEDDTFEWTCPGEICVRSIEKLNAFCPTLGDVKQVPGELKGFTKKKDILFFNINNNILYKNIKSDKFEKLPTKLIYNVEDINFNPTLKIISKKDNKICYKNIQRIYDFVKDLEVDISLPDKIEVTNLNPGDILELELDVSKSNSIKNIPEGVSAVNASIIEGASKYNGYYKEESPMIENTFFGSYKLINSKQSVPDYPKRGGYRSSLPVGAPCAANVITTSSEQDALIIEDCNNKVKLKVMLLEDDYYIVVMVKDNIEKNSGYPANAIMGRFKYKDGLTINTTNYVKLIKRSYDVGETPFGNDSNEIRVTSFKRYKLTRFEERIFTLDNILFKPLNLKTIALKGPIGMRWSAPKQNIDEVMVDEGILKDTTFLNTSTSPSYIPYSKSKRTLTKKFEPKSLVFGHRYIAGWQVVCIAEAFKDYNLRDVSGESFKKGSLLKDFWIDHLQYINYGAPQYFEDLKRAVEDDTGLSIRTVMRSGDGSYKNTQFRDTVASSILPGILGLDHIYSLYIIKINRQIKTLYNKDADDGSLSYLLAHNDVDINRIPRTFEKDDYRGQYKSSLPKFLAFVSEMIVTPDPKDGVFDISGDMYKFLDYDRGYSPYGNPITDEQRRDFCNKLYDKILDNKEFLKTSLNDSKLVSLSENSLKNDKFNSDFIRWGLGVYQPDNIIGLETYYNFREYFSEDEKLWAEDMHNVAKELLSLSENIKIHPHASKVYPHAKYMRGDYVDSYYLESLDTAIKILELNGIVPQGSHKKNIEHKATKALENLKGYKKLFEKISAMCELNNTWSKKYGGYSPFDKIYTKYSKLSIIKFKIDEIIASKYSKKDVYQILIPGIKKSVTFKINGRDELIDHVWLDYVNLSEPDARLYKICDNKDVLNYLLKAIEKFQPLVDEEYKKLMDIQKSKIEKINTLDELKEFMLDDMFNYVIAYNKNSFYNKTQYKAWPPLTYMATCMSDRSDRDIVDVSKPQINTYILYKNFFNHFGLGDRLLDKIDDILTNKNFDEYFEVALYSDEWKSKYKEYNEKFFTEEYDQKYAKLEPFNFYARDITSLHSLCQFIIMMYGCYMNNLLREEGHFISVVSSAIDEYLGYNNFKDEKDIMAAMILSNIIKELEVL